MDVPAELFYSEDHQWVRVEGDNLRVGITAYAQDAIGEVTLVQLLSTGSTIAAGDELGEVEALKAVSDLYMPVAGTIAEHNNDLVDEPTAINADPYGKGWICVVRPNEPAATATASLLTADGYRALVGQAA